MWLQILIACWIFFEMTPFYRNRTYTSWVLVIQKSLTMPIFTFFGHFERAVTFEQKVRFRYKIWIFKFPKVVNKISSKSESEVCYIDKKLGDLIGNDPKGDSTVVTHVTDRGIAPLFPWDPPRVTRGDSTVVTHVTDRGIVPVFPLGPSQGNTGAIPW